MANLTYYSFNKRSKSTKQPAGGGTTIDVKLKGGTDLLSQYADGRSIHSAGQK